MWENILNPERLSQVLQAQQERLSSQRKKVVSGQMGDIFYRQSSQLQGSGIRLQKMGEPGVPAIAEYIESVLGESENIGFDGRTIGITEGEQYEKIAKEKHGQVYYGCDLIDEIWEERPNLSEKPAFYLEETYTGESTVSKLKRVRERMEKENTEYHLLTSLDDIGLAAECAWTGCGVFSASAFLCADHHGFCGTICRRKKV